MNLRIVAVAVIAIGLALAAWFHRGWPSLAGVSHAVGVAIEGSTPETAPTLKAAGVHKCVGGGRTTYVDGACPAGMREVAATGGTVTVTAFPKLPASSVPGGPIVKPMDPEERDRLRDKAVDDAMNRR